MDVSMPPMERTRKDLSLIRENVSCACSIFQWKFVKWIKNQHTQRPMNRQEKSEQPKYSERKSTMRLYWAHIRLYMTMLVNLCTLLGDRKTKACAQIFCILNFFFTFFHSQQKSCVLKVMCDKGIRQCSRC